MAAYLQVPLLHGAAGTCARIGVLAAVVATTINCSEHSTWSDADYRDSLDESSWIVVCTSPLFLGNAAYLYLISLNCNPARH